MSSSKPFTLEAGDRFLSRDSRDDGRIVEVVTAPALDDKCTTCKNVTVRTEVHPRNPSAVGRVVHTSPRTLRTRYERISR